MKKETSLYRATLPILLFCLPLALLPAQALGAMSDYCSPPPFVAQNISPNILIVLDNSGSMCGQAYGGVYNPTQFTNSLYYGYFDGAKRYLYNGSRWEETTNALNTGTAANPVATGSFLNWATMRRIEVAKKLLIGGKADPRSPAAGNTVKLKAEIGCSNSRVFSKNFDTSAGTLIFPFVGDYNFKNDDGNLVITSNSGAGTINYVRPNADISMPAGWSEFPVNPPTIAYTKVDEDPSDADTTYIQSNNTAASVLMDYAYAGAEPAGTITVSVYVRAKKTASGGTRRVVQILRVDGVDYEGGADTVGTNYDTYSATWATNPSTGAAWTWDQIKQLAVAGRIDGFGVRAEQAYSNKFIRVTQVYLRIDVTSPSGGPYNIIVDQGMVDAKGLVDNLDNEVRFGLAYYNNSNAGRVDNYIGFNSPVNMITSIGNMVPSTWTPLGETLHEMVRYFRQDSPYYTNNPADYSVGAQDIGNPNIFRDPYAYKFTDTTSGLPDQYVPCAKSFILFLTDGESTQDQSMPGSSTASPYAACSSTNLKACSGYGGAPINPNPRHAGTSIGTTYSSSGTDYMIDVAYWARTTDARPGSCTTTPTTWDQCLPGTQNIFLYPVYMFGRGSSLLKDAAIYGGFNDINGNNKPDCTTLPAECYKDSNGNGTIESDGSDLPLTYYEGDDGYALEQNLINAIADILKRAASGTAVSVLSSSEGSGANLMQALFYPKRSFDNGTEAAWISDMMNYWYYMDPFFTSSQIREDTVREGVNYTLLDLKQDYVTLFGYDATLGKTMANRWADSTGTGTTLVSIPPAVEIERTLPIWRAGYNLWWTDPSNRTIKTSVNGSSLIDFTTANDATLDDYLGQTASSAAAKKTIEYVRGYDCADATTGEACVCGTANCVTIGRSRTVTSKTCSERKNPCSSVSDCTATETCAQETHVWKLGDIISSTPRIMGPSALDSFNKSFPFGYSDQTYNDFIKSTDYTNRELVFVGANDGMLHAFKLGKLIQTWAGKNWYEAAKQEGSLGVGGIGTESYAYIPKNTLPYLQYLYDPNYCHVYMVDGPLALTEAAISKPSTCTLTDYWECPKATTMQAAPNNDRVDFAKTSWRTTLIGSMGIGGATCDAASPDADRISTPLSISGTPTGWSSYFALDVTDQTSPQLLWEYSNADLGVSNVGPAYVRVAKKVCSVSGATCATDSDCGASANGTCITEKRCAISNAVCATSSNCGDVSVNGQCVEENGRWFAILANGPTGPISSQQFRGTSDKNLKLFILDLKTGTLLRTIDTGITNAFAGSLSTNALDLEKDRPSDSGTYQDDAVYIGYVQGTTSGGVIRLALNDDLNYNNWTASKVIDGIGPVTTSVVNLLDRANQKLWLYFAEGRFFYKQDDLATQRRLYGIQDPCFEATNNRIKPTCSDADKLALANLKDQTSSPASTLLATEKGWYLNMNAPTGTLSAERAISNPTPDPLGAIYFLSFAPNADICSFGGTTYLWALDYGTGGKVRYVMQGKALIQVSTGEIKELSMSSAFTEAEQRKSAGFLGIPPTGQGLMVVTNPTPLKKFMHVQEQ